MSYLKRTAALSRLLLCFALMLSLAACDSGGDDGDDDDDNGGEEVINGTFSIDITGDGIDESMNGAAFFGEATEEGETVFVIYFGDADEDTPSEIDTQDGFFGGFVRESGGGVSAQTYTVVSIESDDAAPDEFLFVFITNGGSVLFGSESGSLTVSSRSDNVIRGSFDVQGVRVDAFAGTETPVTLNGTFEAENANTFTGIPFPAD